MRKVVLGLALLSGLSIAHADTGSNGLFDCMDAKTFELNNQCMANKIETNIRFREAQQQVVKTANENSNDYVIATMTFDPKKMQIDIVAHRDALIAKNTLASKK